MSLEWTLEMTFLGCLLLSACSTADALVLRSGSVGADVNSSGLSGDLRQLRDFRRNYGGSDLLFLIKSNGVELH